MKYLISLLTLISFSCISGGSHEKAKITQFSQVNETDFILLLTPHEKEFFSELGFYKGKCDSFIVIGKFESQGLLASGYIPDKKTHVAAVKYLANSKGVINFGFIGQGFKKIDSKNNCVVESRALKLEQLKNESYVYSWFSAT